MYASILIYNTFILFLSSLILLSFRASLCTHGRDEKYMKNFGREIWRRETTPKTLGMMGR